MTQNLNRYTVQEVLVLSVKASGWLNSDRRWFVLKQSNHRLALCFEIVLIYPRFITSNDIVNTPRRACFKLAIMSRLHSTRAFQSISGILWHLSRNILLKRRCSCWTLPNRITTIYAKSPHVLFVYSPQLMFSLLASSTFLP